MSPAPSALRTVAKIVSQNALRSPLSGVFAAMFTVTFLERRNRGGTSGSWGPRRDGYWPLGTVVVGDRLDVVSEPDGSAISIPAQAIVLRKCETPRGGVPVCVSLPPNLVGLAARARGIGVLCYREVVLRENDRVLLDAVVERKLTVSHVGYRSGPGVRFIARPDLGRVTLEEL
jgi:hypothetical protein